MYNLQIDDKVIQQCMKDAIRAVFGNKHEKVFKYYEFCKNTKPKSMTSLEHTIRELEKEFTKLPKYIKTYLDDVNKEIASCKHNKLQIIESKLSERGFIEQLDCYLDQAIERFFQQPDLDIDF